MQTEQTQRLQCQYVVMFVYQDFFFLNCGLNTCLDLHLIQSIKFLIFLLCSLQFLHPHYNYVNDTVK